jgi:phosphohistidine phosphatase
MDGFHLVLMRHAKAERGDAYDTDFERPLTERGRRDAPAMGAWLARHGPQPDRVVSSPAGRCRETAELVCAGVGIPADAILWDHDIYEASAATLARVAERHAAGSRALLLVGHNPALDELLLRLSSGPVPRDPTGKLMTTAAVAVLEFTGALSTTPGAATLRALVRPRELA